eukprot:7572351-Pyramimonas_sp.AAC.1
MRWGTVGRSVCAGSGRHFCPPSSTPSSPPPPPLAPPPSPPVLSSSIFSCSSLSHPTSGRDAAVASQRRQPSC